MTASLTLPPEAFAAALSRLPGMGPAQLVALLGAEHPERAWLRVLSGQVRRPEPVGPKVSGGRRVAWADAARRRDIEADWRAMQSAGIRVAYLAGAGFPLLLAKDPDPPGVVFWLGDLEVLARPCVAIVGTRHCTSYGRSVAVELGRDLAKCGVCVVSGLALGIDGAAHQGALMAAGGAGPLGIAASGVDCPYPSRHTELWGRVATAGAVLSEAAPGQPAQRWRFPARNRLIAGLARVVVVVESHAAGGSMLTVGAAADRGIDVLAVPGPVNSPASTGTNQLLYEGLAPARHAGDVLAALGDFRPWPAPSPTGALPATSRGVRRGDAAAGPDHVSGARRLDATSGRVLSAIDRTPTATSVIADRTGLRVGVLSSVLLHLEALDLIRGQGAWWERN